MQTSKLVGWIFAVFIFACILPSALGSHNPYFHVSTNKPVSIVNADWITPSSFPKYTPPRFTTTDTLGVTVKGIPYFFRAGGQLSCLNMPRGVKCDFTQTYCSLTGLCTSTLSFRPTSTSTTLDPGIYKYYIQAKIRNLIQSKRNYLVVPSGRDFMPVSNPDMQVSPGFSDRSIVALHLPEGYASTELRFGCLGQPEDVWCSFTEPVCNIHSKPFLCRTDLDVHASNRSGIGVHDFVVFAIGNKGDILQAKHMQVNVD